MDALILDFDGVIIDSEPIHLRAFASVLAPRGIILTREEYYANYLGFDDHDCFAAVFADRGMPITEDEIRLLTAAKSALVKAAYRQGVPALPGAYELVASAELAGMPIAICSGGLREEIELAGQAVGVLEHVMTIISAENVACGKPDPEGYRLALEALCQLTGQTLRAVTTVVIEDSPAGIEAAKAMRMKVLAVTTSYDASTLIRADRVVQSLADVTVADLKRLTGG